MMNDDDVVVSRASGRGTVTSSGALDCLSVLMLAVEMTGSEGLVPGVYK